MSNYNNKIKNKIKLYMVEKMLWIFCRVKLIIWKFIMKWLICMFYNVDVFFLLFIKLDILNIIYLY